MMFHDTTAPQVTNVTLNVADLNRMRAFYTDVLGLEEKTREANVVVLQIGDSNHTITLRYIASGRRPAVSEAGLFHIAFLLPGAKDLADFLHFASNKGIMISGGDHLVSEALYLNDPEGNGIEIYRDRASEAWHWENGLVRMDTLEVDIEALLEQRSQLGWQGMPKEAMIGHVHLKTHDLHLAQQFYIGKLGLNVVSVLPKALFMSANDYHHHVAVNAWQSHRERIQNHASYGLAHLDIYSPNVREETVQAPEGFEVTLYSKAVSDI